MVKEIKPAVNRTPVAKFNIAKSAPVFKRFDIFLKYLYNSLKRL